MTVEAYSEERYEHHHAEWIEARSRRDHRQAARHLYALRAHLHQLGWLDPRYDVPGYGVRPR
jgi:hypothetical protein